MHTAPSVLVSTMSPDAFAPLDGTPGMCALARDENYHLLWCNDLFASENNRTRAQMLGTTLRDIMPRELAEERERAQRRARDEGTLVAYIQVWRGVRWLSRVWPLDPMAFGVNGYFAILQRLAHADTCPLIPSGPIRLIRSSDMGDLEQLTKRELEVFYHLGMGLSQQDIADVLMRSVKTIANHVDRVYKKLGITNRAQLVRIAAERGLIGFSNEEWRQLIDAEEAAGAR